MTTPSEELVGRVEAATGPDRHIDGDVALALNQVPLSVYPHRSKTQPELWSDGKPGLRARTWMPPRYTASIDEALALTERVLPGVFGTLAFFPDSAEASVMVDTSKPTAGGNVMVSTRSGRATAPTAPLAIILATLRSLTKLEG